MRTDDTPLCRLQEQVAETLAAGEVDTPLGRTLARWSGHRFVVQRDGRWLYEGFVLYFKKLRELMAVLDPSVSPDIPPHLLDPRIIASFFGIPIDEFNWQGGPVRAAGGAGEEGGEPPREVGTAEAADILGVSKDTVLKLKAAGLLEYRNAAPPGSSRPVFRFTRRSVLELRTGYDRDVPVAPRPTEPPRRPVGGGRRFKHLRLED